MSLSHEISIAVRAQTLGVEERPAFIDDEHPVWNRLSVVGENDAT